MIEIYKSQASFREKDFEYVWTGQTCRCWRVRFNHSVEEVTREPMEEGQQPYTETVYSCDYADFYAPLSYNPASALQLAKDIAIQNITEYDNSDAVNQFYYGNMPMWLNKDTRVGLMNSTNITKVAGQNDTTLWLGEQSFTIPCDTAIQMLSQLELYALACYNKTAEHKKAIDEMNSVDDVMNYNFKTGYPEKLHF